MWSTIEVSVFTLSAPIKPRRLQIHSIETQQFVGSNRPLTQAEPAFRSFNRQASTIYDVAPSRDRFKSLLPDLQNLTVSE